MSDVEEALIIALEQSELPKLQTKLNNDDGNAFKIKKSTCKWEFFYYNDCSKS